MKIDITKMPFSTYGSYLAISYLSENFRDLNNEEGLFLKTIHGDVENNLVFQFIPTYNSNPVEYSYEVNESVMVIKILGGEIRICHANPETILIEGRGEGTGLSIVNPMVKTDFNYIHEVTHKDNINYIINHFQNSNRYLLFNQIGKVEIQQDWSISRSQNMCINLNSVNGEFLVGIEENSIEWEPKLYGYSFSQCREDISNNFKQFYESMPTVPNEYEEERKLAAYVNWSSVIKKFGVLSRDAMLMSKNWMCNVWSWDHCFNAMALAYGNPEEAYNQFMIMFDYQDKTGLIPDYINDFKIEYNFCKPPIHGWALDKMMKVMQFNMKQFNNIYTALSKWTNWWINYRDDDNDGICEYHHGNDSGWDNSTAFKDKPTVELPDLAAYLIIQMKVLANVATRLGREKDATEWNEKARKMKEKMLKQCFENSIPIAKINRTHTKVETESLILYLPIVLGEELPEDIRINLISTLKDEKFYTPHGFATESVKSELYKSDGYWRGPIWAPSSMIIIDGLYACGEEELAKEATIKFCEMIKHSGFAENFDAITGEGLRDRAYTWTSSVFLLMAHEYLV